MLLGQNVNINPQALAKNLGSFDQRQESAIRVFAKHCGLLPASEIERFRRCRAHFSTPAQQLGTLPVLELGAKLGLVLPQTFEFVLTFANGQPAGFGYLYQGAGQKSLPDKLSVLVQGAMALHQEEGGSETEALLFARVFRALYPKMRVLSENDPSATALIVGVVPKGDTAHLKIYFNSRLYLASPHRERLSQALAVLGLQAHISVFDTLHRPDLGTRFHGIGIDLGSAHKRFKFYTRMDRKAVVEHFSLVGEALGVFKKGQPEALRQATSFLQALECDGLADDVELAVGLAPDAPPTLKLTQFYVGQQKPLPYQAVGDYLRQVGYKTTSFDEAVRALSKGTEKPQVEQQSVHAVGIELPAAEQPKINLYLRAIL